MSSQQAIAAHPADADSAPDTAPAHLLSPYRRGQFALKNRLVMSPMTRSRALEGNVPNPLAATYYAQRAGAGLIITEATQVSPQGVGYIRTPGIHSVEQVAGWRAVTDAVHRAGGKIFAQLWHVAGFRILIFTTAPCRSRPPRSRPTERCSQSADAPRW
jgi:2,4-dienoyl-CoA reductase-like NADH-dependent reductase (Old Yellow Enzyme family)